MEIDAADAEPICKTLVGILIQPLIFNGIAVVLCVPFFVTNINELKLIFA